MKYSVTSAMYCSSADLRKTPYKEYLQFDGSKAFIEIKTIEELRFFIKNVGQIVMDIDNIIIYDNYIE